MRLCLRMVVVAAAFMLATPAAAQSGRDLGSPRRGERASPRRPRREPSPEVQDLRAVSAAEAANAAPRVYGDGGGDELGWGDPERDLEPMGYVHFVLQAHAAYLGGDGAFTEGVHLGLGPALDFCLLPSLSLHLRVGFRIGAHADLGGGRPLSEGYIRGTALLGIHAARLLSVRIGAELGPEMNFSHPDADESIAAGGAFVGQIGLRIPGGAVELAFEIAADVRPGNFNRGIRPTSYHQVSPRVGGVLMVTF